MNKLMIGALMLALALPGAGCAGTLNAAANLAAATTAGLPPVAKIPAGPLGLTALKSLDELKNAYVAAGQSYVDAVNSGRLKDPLKSQLKSDLLLVASGIGVANSAYKIGNADSLSAQIKEGQRLIGVVLASLPKKAA